MQFKIVKMKIQTRIPIAAISDPQPHIVRYLDTLLLKYTHTNKGIPLSFELVGMAHKNLIYRDSPFMFIDCIVDFLVLEVAIGDVVEVRDGLFMGIFFCEHEGFSGKMVVCDVRNEEDAVFYGEQICT